MKIKKFWRLDVAAINSHVNIGLRNGVIEWTLRKHRRVVILLLSECTDEQEIAKHLPAHWDTWPEKQPGEKRGAGGNEAGTYVAYNTRRFLFMDGINDNLSFGKWPRRLTGAVLFDKRTRRLVFVSAHHPDPLNPRDWDDANAQVIRRHVRQVSAFVDWHSQHRHPNHLNISGGDTNENLSVLDHPDSADRQFRRAGMFPTFRTAKIRSGPVRLMNIFTNNRSGNHEVIAHRSYDTGIKGMDHEVVVSRLKVRRW